MQFPKKATQSGLRIYDAAVRGHGGLKSARHEDVFRIRINFFHHDESRAHITRELHERVPGNLNVQEANNFRQRCFHLKCFFPMSNDTSFSFLNWMRTKVFSNCL